MKTRLDVALFERGLSKSREEARALVMAGLVYLGETKAEKAGQFVTEETVINVRGETCPFVSRGGLKLQKAMQEFPISLEGAVAADIGASTGGFTDCMLQSGAKQVYAIDVGYGQLDWKLRSDERVVVLERTNARVTVLADPRHGIVVRVETEAGAEPAADRRHAAAFSDEAGGGREAGADRQGVRCPAGGAEECR